MRPVQLIGDPGRDASEWFEAALREIERASQEADVGEIADTYTITTPNPFTPVRALNSSTATLAQLRDVVATLLLDFKARGTNRGS